MRSGTGPNPQTRRKCGRLVDSYSGEWHTFRHTFSSMLRANGEDLKVQQELLRHADIRTTMNVYTQAMSDQKRQAHTKIVRLVLNT